MQISIQLRKIVMEYYYVLMIISIQLLPSLIYHLLIFFFNPFILQVDVPVSQNIINDVSGDTSQALSQALHEKVCDLV